MVRLIRLRPHIVTIVSFLFKSPVVYDIREIQSMELLGHKSKYICQVYKPVYIISLSLSGGKQKAQGFFSGMNNGKGECSY